MIYKIKSNSSCEKYSDGSQCEHSELAFFIGLKHFTDLCDKYILKYYEENKSRFKPIMDKVEDLFILGKLNPNNKLYKKHKRILDVCLFSGICEVLDKDDFYILNKIDIKKELDKELKKKDGENVYVQDRIGWEVHPLARLSFYRRIGVKIANKSITHRKENL